MQSATSFFNPALSKSLLRPFWPLIGGYGLIWALILPLREISTYLSYRRANILSWDGYLMALDSELGVGVSAGVVMSFLFGILFAMAMFSYLTNPRATGGLHALPLRRESHFWTAYLTGLGAQVAVQLATALLSFAVMALAGYTNPGVQGLSLVGMLLPTVWFYSFGVLCMIFTGQILAAPVFYGILSILPVGLQFLITEFAGQFLYGWGGSSTDETVELLTPIYQMLYSVHGGVERTVYDAGAASTDYLLRIDGWQYLAIYAAAGLVLTVLSLLVYRKRASEETGTTVAVRWARPIFQYGVTFCTALALGQILYNILFDRVRSNGNYSRPGILLCMAIAGLIGFFAAEMLLKKSVRVWKTGWKGALVVTAVMMAFGFGLTQDITGYEGFQPEIGEIRQATVWLSANYSGGSTVLVDDPETMQLVLDTHRAFIRDKARQQRLADSARNYDDENISYVDFRVTYLYPSGRVVTRQYSDMAVYRDELNDPDSPASLCSRLYNSPDFAYSRVLGVENANSRVVYERKVRMTGGYMSFPTGTAADSYYEETDLTAQQAQDILEAVERDMAAGRGNAGLFGNRRTVSSDWGIELYGVYTDEKGKTVSVYMHPQVDDSMRETIAVLSAIRQSTIGQGNG